VSVTSKIEWHKSPVSFSDRCNVPLSVMARDLAESLARDVPDRKMLHRILAASRQDEIEVIRQAAEQTLLQYCGDTVRLRGLIEFSNRCVCDCHYCGIRRGNRSLKRYTLKLDDIVETARWCGQKGYGSVVLQSGERRDARFTKLVTEAVRAIKAETRSAELPEGVGITLCVGEQSADTYAAWYDAGAHRYLLRMESSSPDLFKALHPANQIHASRVQCLKTLKELGYQVGTGVMIGLPGQTLDDLVGDVMFFRDMGVDMIGMGPYIPHEQAVLPGGAPIPDVTFRMQLSLKMIAATRLLLRDVNIAATTALQTLAPEGREQGLRFGANVIMPQVTPPRVRRMYTLYDGKPCLDDDAEQCANCLEGRISSVGRKILYNDWGDSAHYFKRRSNAT
jgi:biotin synthase